MREDIRTFILERIAVEDRGHSSPCWTWQHWTNEKGYAVADFRGSRFRVHRASYEVFKEPIPCWLETDHLCCNSSCVNPDHLEPVTSPENRRRQAIRRGDTVGGRRARGTPAPPRTHCPNGHPYSSAESLTLPSRCRCEICYRARKRRLRVSQAEKRAAARESLGGEARPSGVSQRFARHIAHDGRGR